MVSGLGFWYPMAALMPARAVHKLRIVFTAAGRYRLWRRLGDNL